MRHRLFILGLVSAAALAPVASTLAQSPFQFASVPSSKVRDTDRVLTFGPASLMVRGPEKEQILLRATELDLEVQFRVDLPAVAAWVAKADVMLLLVGKTEPIPLLRGDRGSVDLRPLSAFGRPRYEMTVSDRERKRKVIAELSFEQANVLLETLRALAPPPPEAPKPSAAVDRPVAPKANNRAPTYPPLLRSLGVGGEVVIRAVVDTTGRVEKSSVELVRATDERLVRPVRDAVLSWRFVPAESGGRRVRQLIELPFVFSADQ